MCDPTGVSYAAIAMAVVGTATSAMGQMQAQKSQKAAANYQAQVAANNKILANRAAEDALMRGKLDADKQKIAGNQLISRQKAVMAQNGIVINQDTALDITTDTAETSTLDALTIRNNSEREAAGFRAQGENFQAQSDLALLSGKNSGGGLAIAGTIATGLGSVASKWYGFSKASGGADPYAGQTYNQWTDRN